MTKMIRLTKQEALEKTRAMCARREYCTAEIEQKLSGWGLSGEEVKEVIDGLREEGFLDEFRYARAFVRDRVRFNKWGKLKIRHALRMKGVNNEVIEPTLDEVDSNEYLQMMRVELQKKRRTVKGNTLAVRARLQRFAFSRGFEPELANRLIEGLSHGDPFEMG
ncbi:MAG TPA: RecX family transcriptional regulator [Bacteroidetes bacterium]|nr:RecX family transcriptional regulator [Bacteroidota bacterium]